MRPDALSLVSVVAVNDLNAFVYQVPPYNMTAAINGLLNIPSLSKFRHTRTRTSMLINLQLVTWSVALQADGSSTDLPNTTPESTTVSLPQKVVCLLYVSPGS